MKQTEAKWNKLEGADILSVLLGLLRISRQKARRWARATQLSKADLLARKWLFAYLAKLPWPARQFFRVWVFSLNPFRVG